jgi:hypothetical protein
MHLVARAGIWRMTRDERLERYRLNAEKCLTLAQTFNDHQSKRTLIQMANTWLKLAEQQLKNSETTLVYETPTPRLKTSDDDLK